MNVKARKEKDSGDDDYTEATSEKEKRQKKIEDNH
jgi:hypothetical protein